MFEDHLYLNPLIQIRHPAVEVMVVVDFDLVPPLLLNRLWGFVEFLKPEKNMMHNSQRAIDNVMRII